MPYNYCPNLAFFDHFNKYNEVIPEVTSQVLPLKGIKYPYASYTNNSINTQILDFGH